MISLLTYICTSLLVCSDVQFIQDYAPRIYMDKNEEYFPCSIEYFKQYTHLEIIENKFWTISNENLAQPSDILPYFHGQDISTNPPVYVIVMPDITEKEPVLAMKYPLEYDIVATYFTFYAYNRGKRYLDTVWDNHIGDIEHAHIFFSKGIPQKIIASYHAWNVTKSWSDPHIERVDNHTILYSAKGSHGLWFSNGSHQYHSDPNLSDETSNGDSWDTWKNMQIITPFNWGSYGAYGVNWLTLIFRWGNPHTDFPVDNCFFDFCRFSDGPIGMLGKSEIQQTIEHLKNEGYVCPTCIWSSGIY